MARVLQYYFFYNQLHGFQEGDEWMDGIWEGYYGKNVMREELMIGVGLFFSSFLLYFISQAKSWLWLWWVEAVFFSYVRRIRKKR